MDTSLLFASSTLFWTLPSEQWFRLAKTYGLGGIEIWAQQLESNKISAEEIRRAARYYGLHTTIHNYSWDINLLSLNRSQRSVAVHLTKKAIELASYLNSLQVTIHPGRELFRMPGADYDLLLAESADSLGRFAQVQGTTASFEIMEKIPKERVTSVEAIYRMEAVGNTAICWKYTEDIAHCDSTEEILHIAAVLNGRISEFHLSNKKGIQRHITDMAAGDFNLPEIVKELSSYNIPFILEGMDTSPASSVFYNALSYLGVEKKHEDKIEKNDSSFNMLYYGNHSFNRLR
jgi:sugar phosphate isomerase/epimerase